MNEDNKELRKVVYSFSADEDDLRLYEIAKSLSNSETRSEMFRVVARYYVDAKIKEQNGK